MARSRTQTTIYGGWEIRTSPTSHRGERIYEAAIYSLSGELADVAHSYDRTSALAEAIALVDKHRSGKQLLHNLRPFLLPEPLGSGGDE
jgi:hypothetical protein